MAGPKKTRGFTLVELLVVITIIGMLVSLLLPAIQSAREAGRKNTCQNNMRNCGLALSQFADNKKGFPGYSNLLGAGTPNARRASWVVTILPYLERNDIYQNWQNVNIVPSMMNNNLQNFAAQLAVLVCPSNASQTTGVYANPLSFVVNTGIALTADDNGASPATPNTTPVIKPYPAAGPWDDLNSGVFFNQSRWDGTMATAPSVAGGKKSTMDFISTNDGTSYTLMLSENLQATNWATEAIDANPTRVYQSDFSLRQNTGFVWYPTGNPNNFGPPVSTISSYNTTTIGINAQGKVFTTMPPLLPFNSMATITTPTGLACARPSSNHPGGVNVFFCDGHGRFIAEDIGYHVYTQLMTSNQASVNIDGAGTTAKTAWVTATQPLYLLDESQY